MEFSVNDLIVLGSFFLICGLIFRFVPFIWNRRRKILISLIVLTLLSAACGGGYWLYYLYKTTPAVESTWKDGDMVDLQGRPIDRSAFEGRFAQ